MHFFILLDSPWIPNALILEPILIDLMHQQEQASEVHYFIMVSEQEPAALPKNVECLTPKAALEKAATLAEGMVLHFGTQWKSVKHFPQFFMPIFLPHMQEGVSFFQNRWTRWKYQKQLSRCIQTAHKVLSVKPWNTALLNSLPISILPTEKIQTAYLPHQPIGRFDWADLAKARSELTNGNQYFLVFSSLSDFVDTIKAFSIFKKWQQTAMSIVFIFDNTQTASLAERQLRGYRFKDSVEIKTVDEFQFEWLDAAYLTVFNGVEASSSLFLYWSMEFQKPFLFNLNPLAKVHFILPNEIIAYGDCFDFYTKEALSNNFKHYYKDELYRIEKAEAAYNGLVNSILIKQSAADITLPDDLVS